MLLPNLTQLAFATMLIGGGGITFAKSAQGHNIVSNSEVSLTQPVSSTVTRAETQTSPSVTVSEVPKGPAPVKPEEQTETQKILEQEVPVKAENCQVILQPRNVPEGFREETKDYVSVTCEDKTSDSFPTNWKGLFPKSIFKSGEQLNEGKELVIKIADTEVTQLSDTPEAEGQEYWSKVSISSPEFSTPEMSAEWSYAKENDSWAVIKVTQPPFDDKIYLLLNEDEETQKEEVAVVQSKGNCEIIDSLNYTPESFKGNADSYFSISCDTSGVDTFPDPLKGLFPKDLFKEESQLTVNKRFDLRIETDMEGEQESEEGFGITFSGEQFPSSPIKGSWDYEENGPGVIVKLKDNKEIYLLLSDVDSE